MAPHHDTMTPDKADALASLCSALHELTSHMSTCRKQFTAYCQAQQQQEQEPSALTTMRSPRIDAKSALGFLL